MTADDSPTRPLAGARREKPRSARTVFWTLCPFVVPAAAMAAAGSAGLTDADLGARELLTRAAAALGPEQILAAARRADAADAPYHLLLHHWTQLAGDSVAMLRAPSLAAMVLGVGLAGELGRRILGPGTGLCAGLLLVALPQTSRYAQDASPYAVAFLLAVAATLLLYRTVDRPRWWGRGTPRRSR